MNIVIDQGNTSAKVALFERSQLLTSFHFESLTESILQQIILEHHPESGILCSVKQMDSLILSSLESSISNFFVLNANTSIPLTIDYRTPQTLGMDRIAAATGAYKRRKESNLLVIDIGTAITFDYIERRGIYRGGNISPGPTLRFKALHHYTSKLPLLDEQGDIPNLGYDTETAIRAGVINGIVHEIDSYIDDYTKKHDVFTFLTGGYSFYFETKLKSSIFADENLVLKGLNEILDYQRR